MFNRLLMTSVLVFNGLANASTSLESELCSEVLQSLNPTFHITSLETAPFGDAVLCLSVGDTITENQNTLHVTKDGQRFAIVFPNTQQFATVNKEQIELLFRIEFHNPRKITIQHRNM